MTAILRARILLPALAASALLGATARAQTPNPIDAWEPVQSGGAVPSAAAKSHRTRSAWLGYSDGHVYFTSNPSASTPSWQRMDAGSNHGTPYDMGFTRPVTAIATGDSYDDYIAYIAFNGWRYYGQLYRCQYSKGNIFWTQVSPQYGFADIRGVSVSPLDINRVYVATGGGVFYSTDRGATWQTSNAGDPLTPPDGGAISAVASAWEGGPDRILVGTTSGQIWAVSGARSGAPVWTRVDNRGAAQLPAAAVTRLQLDDRDATNRSWLAVYGGQWSGALWRTGDDGLSFSEIPHPILQGYPHPPVNSASLAPTSLPGNATLYGEAGAYWWSAMRSDDNGGNWFVTPRWSGKNLVVEYKHYDWDNWGNQLMPLFRVRNLGSTAVSLSGFKINYAFSEEGSAAQTYYCDWTPYGCNNIQGTVTPSLLSIVFSGALSGATVNLAAGAASGEIQGRVAKSDWTNYDQTNDFSFIAGARTDWVQNRRVVLYDAAGGWLSGTSVP